MKIHNINLFLGWFILGWVVLDVLFSNITLHTVTGALIGTANVMWYCLIEVQE
ncbi:hypothetical protein LCGC14_1295940 [marine sediment metagenome]|uniref:Uncharacterized protein n=1 Tax=marine sediment metagenome TaxID=412755 RepID=A0A0F9N7I3_9ZZZZ